MIKLLLLCLKYFNCQVVFHFSEKWLAQKTWGKWMHEVLHIYIYTHTPHTYIYMHISKIYFFLPVFYSVHVLFICFPRMFHHIRDLWMLPWTCNIYIFYLFFNWGTQCFHICELWYCWLLECDGLKKFVVGFLSFTEKEMGFIWEVSVWHVWSTC